MAYSEPAADRLRTALTDRDGVTEKEMFGGIAFLLNGNMALGVSGNDLIVRVDPSETDALLGEPGARIFDLSGGRPMKGWLLVQPAGFRTEAAFRRWLMRGVDYVSRLPKKKGSGTRSKRSRARR